MDLAMKPPALSKVMTIYIVSTLVFSGPIQAQSCDEECFIINNTFGQETLKRFLKAFPNSTHVEEAKQRLEYLDKINTKGSAVSGFPSPTIKETVTIPASQVPANPLGR
jgi:hypothetical protein